MKRERRHELQHNDLAEWIVKGYERIVPYRNAILGAGLLLIVLVIALMVWHSHSVAQAGEAWNSLGIPVFLPVYADERTIGHMQQIAQTDSGLAAGEWAAVFAGDSALMVGTNKILTDKKVGIEYLTQARDIYAKVLPTLTIDGAREQAMFGQARAIESLIQNKAQIDEAIAAYQDLNKKYPSGMFKPIADQRIELLQKKETLTLYETLAQYTPAPKPVSPRSQSNTGNVPENPPEEPLVPTPPVRGEGSPPAPILPEPSSTPSGPVIPLLPKTDIPATELPKPDTSKNPKSEPVKPQAVEPDTSKPEPAKTDTPKTDVPKTDAPKTDVPKTEAAKKDK